MTVEVNFARQHWRRPLAHSDPHHIEILRPEMNTVPLWRPGLSMNRSGVSEERRKLSLTEMAAAGTPLR